MTTKSLERSRLIKLIHVARRELCMADESYRAMLSGMPELKGKTSSATCNIKQLKAILEQLKMRGFKIKKNTRKLASDPQSKKIRWLWLELRKTGKINDASEQALASYVRRLTGVSALQWLSSAQCNRVIETLKKWLERAG